MIHDILKGFKTLASLESWILDITRPAEIVQNLRGIVDSFIIGSMHYCEVPCGFYADRLLPLVVWLDKSKIKCFLKKELRGASREIREEAGNLL